MIKFGIPVKFLVAASLGLGVLATTTAPAVQAQTFLDRLFGVPSANRRAIRARRYDRYGRYNRNGKFDRYGNIYHVVEEPVKTVTVKKVRAPRYFTYKPASMSAAGFGALASLDASVKISKDNLETPSKINRFERSRFISATGYLSNFKPMANKSVIKAVIEHYTRNPGFIWVKNYKQTEHALEVLATLRAADNVGLSAQEYIVEVPTANGTNATSRAEMEGLIKFELSLTLRALRYASDARHGRVNPNRLSEYHYFPKNKPDATVLMADLFNAENPASHLQSLHPQGPEFKALVAELAKARNETEVVDLVVIKKGTFMRPGNEGPEFVNIIRGIRKFGSAELLTSHGALLDAFDGSSLYSEPYVEVVKAFQKENQLKPDGVIGRNTLSKMSEQAPTDKIANVLYAIERLRWHPPKLGNRYVLINQPAYRASYFNDGKEQLSMRAIVGKRSNQTNFFYDEIEKVVYNPYWGIPRSILVNEMLPKLRNDPGYFDKRGYELTTIKGTKISSASVNWNTVGSNFGYNVRQLPGSRNALGSVKILFPNKFAIYMHDTPSRGLFKRTRRALSHGCVRLQKPQAMAAAVLGTEESYVVSRIKAGKNATEKLTVKIPVYVAYFTAWPEADGTVKYYSDIYGRDGYLKKAMDKTTLARAAQS